MKREKILSILRFIAGAIIGAAIGLIIIAIIDVVTNRLFFNPKIYFIFNPRFTFSDWCILILSTVGFSFLFGAVIKRESIIIFFSFTVGTTIGVIIARILLAIFDAYLKSRYPLSFDPRLSFVDWFIWISATVMFALPIGHGIFSKLIKSPLGDSTRAANEQINALLSYDQDTNTLTVLGRDEGIKKRITIRPIVLVENKYNDPTLVYTGVTVGGITTGGFHVEGGDYTQQIHGSKKYKLMYQDIFPIDKIILTDALASEAKNNGGVSIFLKGNEMVLAHNIALDTLWISAAEAAEATNKWEVANYARQKAALPRCLDKNECKCIRDWLSGK